VISRIFSLREQMLLLIFVTVQKKARGLYHSNDGRGWRPIQRSYLHLERATRGRGLKRVLLGRTSERGSQASRLEMVVTWGTGRNACATEKLKTREAWSSLPCSTGDCAP
jgi:hypothetical protein